MRWCEKGAVYITCQNIELFDWEGRELLKISEGTMFEVVVRNLAHRYYNIYIILYFILRLVQKIINWNTSIMFLFFSIAALSFASSSRDFDPRTRPFSDEELKPQPMVKKSRKQVRRASLTWLVYSLYLMGRDTCRGPCDINWP